MKRSDLLLAMRATPFRPFNLVMIDGTKYPVPHEDFAHVMMSGNIVYEYPADKPPKILNSLLVARVEFLEEAAER